MSGNEILIHYSLCNESEFMGIWLETLIETEHQGKPATIGYVSLEPNFAKQVTSLLALTCLPLDAAFYFGKLLVMRINRAHPHCDNPECFCAFIPPSPFLAILGTTSESKKIETTDDNRRVPWPPGRPCTFCDSPCSGFQHAQDGCPHCWTCNEHYHLKREAHKRIVDCLKKADQSSWSSVWRSLDDIALETNVPHKGVQYSLNYLLATNQAAALNGKYISIG